MAGEAPKGEMMSTHVVYVYRGLDDQWYWRKVETHNGKKVADGGEGFTRKWSAKRAARRANPSVTVVA